MLKAYKEEIKKVDKEAQLGDSKTVKVYVRRSPKVIFKPDGEIVRLYENPYKAKL